MIGLYSDFKNVLKRHLWGLPLTSLFSLALSSALPILRWPCHVAFFQTLKKAENSDKPFPDFFFNVLLKHILFFAAAVFLVFPLLYLLIILSALLLCFTELLANLIFLIIVIGACYVFAFFLLHPLSFYLAYAWENREDGFVYDLKLLKAYLSHWFGRPGEHLLFTIKCFLVYFVTVILVIFAIFFFCVICSLLNFAFPLVLKILTAVVLALITLAFIAFSFLYIAPFIAFVTLKLYEPLAPKPGEEKRKETEAGVPLLESGKAFFWKMTVSYDGTKFCGWQFQLGARTVQGELTEALRRLLLEDVVLTAASRTDSGVHSLGQTVCFKTTKDIPAEKLLKGVNSFVPDDISVTKVESVDESFHPTFNAFGKHYQYRVYTAESDDVMTRKYHYWIRRDFNIDAMRQAAALMVGEREFKGLQVKSGKPNEATLRLVTAVDVSASENEIIIDIFGKGFMYKQVRSMVGLLLAVGEGRVKVEEVDALCSGTAECRKSSVAPPQGLTLVKVYYSQEEFEARS